MEFSLMVYPECNTCKKNSIYEECNDYLYKSYNTTVFSQKANTESHRLVMKKCQLL